MCVTSEWLTVSCVIHDIRRRHRIARPRDSGRTATNYAPARPGPPPLLATTSDATLPYLSSHISGLWRSPTVGAAPLSGRRSHRPRDTLPIRHSIHPHCLPSGASSHTRVSTRSSERCVPHAAVATASAPVSSSSSLSFHIPFSLISSTSSSHAFSSGIARRTTSLPTYRSILPGAPPT